MPIEEVLDLDVLTFNAYVQATVRTMTAQRISNAWTIHIAGQGETKVLKKWIKGLLRKAGLDQAPAEQKSDAGALFQLFKGGKGL